MSKPVALTCELIPHSPSLNLKSFCKAQKRVARALLQGPIEVGVLFPVRQGYFCARVPKVVNEVFNPDLDPDLDPD